MTQGSVGGVTQAASRSMGAETGHPGCTPSASWQVAFPTPVSVSMNHPLFSPLRAFCTRELPPLPPPHTNGDTTKPPTLSPSAPWSHRPPIGPPDARRASPGPARGPRSSPPRAPGQLRAGAGTPRPDSAASPRTPPMPCGRPASHPALSPREPGRAPHLRARASPESRGDPLPVSAARGETRQAAPGPLVGDAAPAEASGLPRGASQDGALGAGSRAPSGARGAGGGALGRVRGSGGPAPLAAVGPAPRSPTRAGGGGGGGRAAPRPRRAALAGAQVRVAFRPRPARGPSRVPPARLPPPLRPRSRGPARRRRRHVGAPAAGAADARGRARGLSPPPPGKRPPAGREGRGRGRGRRRGVPERGRGSGVGSGARGARARPRPGPAASDPARRHGRSRCPAAAAWRPGLRLPAAPAARRPRDTLLPSPRARDTGPCPGDSPRGPRPGTANGALWPPPGRLSAAVPAAGGAGAVGRRTLRAATLSGTPAPPSPCTAARVVTREDSSRADRSSGPERGPGGHQARGSAWTWPLHRLFLPSRGRLNVTRRGGRERPPDRWPPGRGSARARGRGPAT